MKLLDTVTIGGQLFAKGQKIYGNGMLGGQRYTLNIKASMWVRIFTRWI